MNTEKQKAESRKITTATVYFQSPVGLIEIAGNHKQVLSILFVRKEDVKKYSGIIPRVVQQCEKQLNEYFEGKRKTFTISTEQKGTAFQQKTWNFISEIPFGKTKTYLELAKRHWDRNSTRAIGNAVGKNKLSIIVPCHRVIGTDGKLTGYSGGLWRKEWLLKHEKRIAFGIKELF